MQKIYVLIGLPGGGKTSYALNKAKEKNTVIVSRDSIREMLKGSYVFDPLYERLVLDISRDAIKNAFEQGFNVIIDETNLTMVYRLELLQDIKERYLNIYNERHKDDYKIKYIVFSEGLNGDLTKVLERRRKDNKNQSFDTWKRVITEMLCSYQPPNKKIEGFSTLEIIRG